MLQPRELGDAGLTYICERLAGGRTLSRLLLDGLDVAGGHAWTYLPPAMTEGQAGRFAEAGLTRLARGTAPAVFERPDGRWEAISNLVEPLVVAQVRAFLTLEERGVAVWEDPIANAGDRWVRDHDHDEAPLLFVGDEVYHVLSHVTAGPTAVAAGLAVMDAWWGSPAVLAALPAESLRPFLTGRSRLSTEQLQPLVDHCRLLFFLAYDQEGYVLWSSRGREDGGSADASAASVANASQLQRDRGP
jgi:hypothetical protein